MSRLIIAMCLATLALPAFAQANPVDAVIAALRAKGYHIVTQERTWLGRERIIAEDAMSRRELVFNPGTGEVFRDYSVRLSDNAGNSQVATSGDLPAIGAATTGTSDVIDPRSNGGAAKDLFLGDPIVTGP